MEVVWWATLTSDPAVEFAYVNVNGGTHPSRDGGTYGCAGLLA